MSWKSLVIAVNLGVVWRCLKFGTHLLGGARKNSLLAVFIVERIIRH